MFTIQRDFICFTCVAQAHYVAYYYDTILNQLLTLSYYAYNSIYNYVLYLCIRNASYNLYTGQENRDQTNSQTNLTKLLS